MNIIRKISIGKDYPNGAMHYQVGKTVNLQQVPYTIHSIIERKKKDVSEPSVYDIYIANDDGKVKWKTVEHMPVLVENKIDFE